MSVLDNGMTDEEKVIYILRHSFHETPNDAALSHIAKTIIGALRDEPTDDEREALAGVIEPYFDRAVDYNDGTRDDEGLADAILTAGFRRTVQGKPGEHGGPIPLYGMLDVWMALYGTSHPEFDNFYAEHGYAETWARILAAIQDEPTDALPLDPKPWLFISDQIFGEFRSDHDEGYNDVSGTYWVFSPRGGYETDRARYADTGAGEN